MRPLRKGDQLILSGGMFTNCLATIERVDWLENGQRFLLRVTGITCPISYGQDEIERFQRHGIDSN